jgi:hypothetical protein
MPTEAISCGPVFSMIQNTVYSLPACHALLFTTGAPTLQQSTVLAMTAPVSITLTNGQAEVAGGFIRCTSAGPQLITLKRA